MIDVHLLGIGGMMPLPHRWLSSLLIRCESEMTLFDCGEGTQVPMRASGWGFKRLSSIVLTHLHADHVMGMTGVLFSVANAGRTEPLTIFGPPGTLQVAQALTIVVPGLPMEVMVQEVEAGDRLRLPAGVDLTVGQADHRDRCFFYRVDRARDPVSMSNARGRSGIPVQFWSFLQRGESVDWEGRSLPGADFRGPPRQGVSLGFVTDTRPVRKCPKYCKASIYWCVKVPMVTTPIARKAVEKTHMTFREAATIASESACRERSG